MNKSLGFIFCLILFSPLIAQEKSEAVTTDSTLHFGSVSLYSENDKYFAGTDEYYTNGFKLSFLSTDLNTFTDQRTPWPARKLAQFVGQFSEKDADYKLGLSIGQNMYTPINTQTTLPQPFDRPYAAWLYGGLTFQNYLPAVRRDGSVGTPRLDVFEINAGVVGPDAIGRQVQNAVHSIIGAKHALGWANQIHNEAGINLIFERKYRFQTEGARTGWGADFIPHGGLSLGNVFTYANTGAEVRVGWKLPADFGTNLIRPSGDSNSKHPSDFSVHLFGSADGRAVARDITLDGNSFEKSASVDKKPLVGDLSGGIAFGFRRFEITYAQAVRSKEFYGQLKPANFGSISLTVFF